MWQPLSVECRIWKSRLRGFVLALLCCLPCLLLTDPTKSSRRRPAREAMSSPNSPTSSGGLGPSWQEKLQSAWLPCCVELGTMMLTPWGLDHCRAAQLHPPVFNIVSDRRGKWLFLQSPSSPPHLVNSSRVRSQWVTSSAAPSRDSKSSFDPPYSIAQSAIFMAPPSFPTTETSTTMPSRQPPPSFPVSRRSPHLLTNSLTGGRTAWSSTVTINQTNISARYWYDGQYVNNAKEDAAEVALQHLLTNSNSSSPISPISPQSQNSMHQGSIWGSAGAGMPQQGAFFGARESRERAWARGSVGTG